MSDHHHQPHNPNLLADSQSSDPPAVDSLQPRHFFPTELVQAIFEHVVTTPIVRWTERSPAPLDPEVRRAPFRLAAVCTRWRNTALQTPEIWSCIHVTNPVVRDPIAYIDVCVDRSGQWPLEVIVNFSSGEILEEIDLIKIWTKLRSQGSRWRRCHFVFGSYDVLWANWPRKSPMLEELVAHMLLDSYFLDDSEMRTQLLPIAPNLTRLSFNSLYRLPGNYGNVEYLSICLRPGPTSGSLLWEVLPHTPFLREVKIFWLFTTSREDMPPQRTISLPRLERLEIYGHTPLDFDTYVARLELPALHTVFVSTSTCYRLVTFFQSLAAQVRTLVVRYEGPSRLALADARAIYQLRCLDTLVISGRRMDNVNLGEAFGSTSSILTFSSFFDALRQASEATDWQLRKLWMLNCTPLRKPKDDLAHCISNSIEINFTGRGKGWDDPRIALFMTTEPTGGAQS